MKFLKKKYTFIPTLNNPMNIKQKVRYILWYIFLHYNYGIAQLCSYMSQTDGIFFF